MEVVTVHNPDFPSRSAGIAIVIWVGSAIEKPEERGLAHVVEHMAFKTTRHLKEGHVSTLAKMCGASFNAFTTFDRIAFYFECDPDNANTITQILYELAFNAVFEQAQLDSEMHAILDEMVRGTNRLASAMWRLRRPYLIPSIWPDHDPIGTAADLVQLKAEKLQNFYNHYFRPTNATLVVVSKEAGVATVAKSVLEARKIEFHTKRPEKTLLYADIQPMKVVMQDTVIRFPHPTLKTDHASTVSNNYQWTLPETCELIDVDRMATWASLALHKVCDAHFSMEIGVLKWPFALISTSSATADGEKVRKALTGLQRNHFDDVKAQFRQHIESQISELVRSPFDVVQLVAQKLNRNENYGDLFAVNERTIEDLRDTFLRIVHNNHCLRVIAIAATPDQLRLFNDAQARFIQLKKEVPHRHSTICNLPLDSSIDKPSTLHHDVHIPRFDGYVHSIPVVVPGDHTGIYLSLFHQCAKMELKAFFGKALENGRSVQFEKYSIHVTCTERMSPMDDQERALFQKQLAEIDPTRWIQNHLGHHLENLGDAFYASERAMRAYTQCPLDITDDVSPDSVKRAFTMIKQQINDRVAAPRALCVNPSVVHSMTLPSKMPGNATIVCIFTPTDGSRFDTEGDLVRWMAWEEWATRGFGTVLMQIRENTGLFYSAHGEMVDLVNPPVKGSAPFLKISTSCGIENCEKCVEQIQKAFTTPQPVNEYIAATTMVSVRRRVEVQLRTRRKAGIFINSLANAGWDINTLVGSLDAPQKQFMPRFQLSVQCVTK